MWFGFRGRIHFWERGLFHTAVVNVTTIQRHIQMWEWRLMGWSSVTIWALLHHSACVRLERSERDDASLKGRGALSASLVSAPFSQCAFTCQLLYAWLDPVFATIFSWSPPLKWRWFSPIWVPSVFFCACTPANQPAFHMLIYGIN